ncbi:MAG TPA: glucose-6-phosphate dehydrogenase assembly protein OpcA [Candidatus Lumbricidophila sp.]|nr:glucose-6-phosphate dehydrogenase assembly protein OpcA [Candidatus Lumbricidophila sp.]
MIVDLPNTTTSKISKTLVSLREEGGMVALGRVLTLIIATPTESKELAIEAANDASREHPMRVIVVETVPATEGAESRLDAEIRVGGDAGASEVIVLRATGEVGTDEQSLVMGLLLPDAPVVVWWPDAAPERPGDTPLGRIATRRVTDAAVHADPQTALRNLVEHYLPGDTDLAWTRLTLWRGQLAAVLDQPPYEPITEIAVSGSVDSPSATLIAAWLQLQLGVPARFELTADGPQGLHRVHLIRPSGTVELERSSDGVARLIQPGQPTHDLALPRRSLRDCLADELRRLDPDELYGAVLTVGLGALPHPAPLS